MSLVSIHKPLSVEPLTLCPKNPQQTSKQRGSPTLHTSYHSSFTCWLCSEFLIFIQIYTLLFSWSFRFPYCHWVSGGRRYKWVWPIHRFLMQRPHPWSQLRTPSFLCTGDWWGAVQGSQITIRATLGHSGSRVKMCLNIKWQLNHHLSLPVCLY